MARKNSQASDDLIRQCILSKWWGDPCSCRWCGRSTGSEQRRWCSPECRRGYMENHTWTEAREARKRLDFFRCSQCNRHRHEDGVQLDAHHTLERPLSGTERRQSGCHHHLNNLRTLCDDCHQALHREEREASMDVSFADNEPLLVWETNE